MKIMRMVTGAFLLAVAGGTAHGRVVNQVDSVPVSPDAQSRRSVPSRRGIPAIAKDADGAVVSIVMLDKRANPIAQGTGFFVSKDGLLVTNFHVIATGSTAIVKFPDGKICPVDGVVTFDKTRDIAVIKVHGNKFKTLTLGDSDRAQIGEEVVAIGNPLFLESTVSNGIISGIRTGEQLGGKFLQTTTPISPGSSGGPLFDMDDQVIGITTMFLKGGENLNFAIPINDAKRLLASSNSADFQNFPNEQTPVNTQKHSGETPPSQSDHASETKPSDRDYYQQLYVADAFARPIPEQGSSGFAMMTRDADYVCFSDNPNSGIFFTFNAYRYDEHWAKLMNEPITKQWVQSSNELKISQETRYVTLLPDLAGFSPQEQKFFRRGGRILYTTVYEKGVDIGGREYRWDGNSWVWSVPAPDPNAYSRTSKMYGLSIEPSTMRYVESVRVTVAVGTGDTAAADTETYGPSAGTCERISNANTRNIEGLYELEDGGDSYLLRFYMDGTVIGVTVQGQVTAHEIGKVEAWFHRGPEFTAMEYLIRGSAIQFSLNPKTGGRIDYRGEIEGTALTLDWFSHINGHRGSGTYYLLSPSP